MLAALASSILGGGQDRRARTDERQCVATSSEPMQVTRFIPVRFACANGSGLTDQEFDGLAGMPIAEACLLSFGNRAGRDTRYI
jgi:hypothetical protein